MMLACLASCTIIKQVSSSSQTTTAKRDSIVTVDTVYVKTEVVKEAIDSNAMALFASTLDSLETNYKLVNDSLAIELAKKDAKLAMLSAQIAKGKFSSDTLRTKTEFAEAWSVVANNELKLGLHQMSVDTILQLLSKRIEVRDSVVIDGQEVITNTVVEQPKTVANPWFWACVGVIVLTLAMLITLMRLHR